MYYLRVTVAYTIMTIMIVTMYMPLAIVCSLLPCRKCGRMFAGFPSAFSVRRATVVCRNCHTIQGTIKCSPST